MPRATRFRKTSGALRRLRDLGNRLAHGLAGEGQRRLPDLLLAPREMEIERAARRAPGRQDVVQRGAMITLPAEQFDRSGESFPFGISSSCHRQKYQLQIGMSTVIICRLTYISPESRALRWLLASSGPTEGSI